MLVAISLAFPCNLLPALPVCCFAYWTDPSNCPSSTFYIRAIRMAVAPLLFLEYDPSAVPEGGSMVVASPGALVKSEGKDPAGHIFHEKALRQLGLLSAAMSSHSPPAAWLLASALFCTLSGITRALRMSPLARMQRMKKRMRRTNPRARVLILPQLLMGLTMESQRGEEACLYLPPLPLCLG